MSTPANAAFSQVDGGADARQGSGLFSHIGGVIKQIAPYIAPIANRLAATFGNSASLEAEYRDRENGLRQQLASSQMDTANLNRQLLQKQVENYRTPEQIAAAGVQQAGALEDVRTLHAPATDQSTPEGVVTTEYDRAQQKRVTHPKMMTEQVPNPALDPYKQADAGQPPNYVQDWNAGPPPSMPATVPHERQVPVLPKVTHGQPIWDPKSNQYLVPVYDAQQQVTRLQPLGGMPASQAPMSPDKMAQQRELQNIRGAAFGQNRPLPMLTDEGTEAYGTLAGGVKPLPNGQLPLTGNQSGAASLGQRRATFSEVDKNLANVKTALSAVDSLSISDRMAIVAGLTPGKSAIGQGIEGIGLANLSPQARSLVDTTRNLRQGVLSLRNVLSSGGAGSDYRINILESEMPNEQDFAASNSQQIAAKLQSFESIYNDIIASYPQLFTQKANRGALTSLPKNVPPMMPSTTPKPAGKWNMQTGQYE